MEETIHLRLKDNRFVGILPKLWTIKCNKKWRTKKEAGIREGLFG